MNALEKLRVERLDPGCPPNWRWRAAERVVQREKKTRHYTADPAIKAAVQYKRRPDKSVEKAIAPAQRLFEVGGLKIWELEARLLAGQSDAEIAQACHLATEVVRWYEQLFCNVRDCLGAQDYLLATFVGRRSWDGFATDDVRQFLAWSAIGGGPLLLSRLLEPLTRRRIDKDPTIAVYLAPGGDQAMAAYAARAILGLSRRTKEIYWNPHADLLDIKAAGDRQSCDARLSIVCTKLIQRAKRHLAGKPLQRPRKPIPTPQRAAKRPRHALKRTQRAAMDLQVMFGALLS